MDLFLVPDCLPAGSSHKDSMAFTFQISPMCISEITCKFLQACSFFPLKKVGFIICHPQCRVDMRINVGNFYSELECPWFEAKCFQMLVKYCHQSQTLRGKSFYLCSVSSEVRKLLSSHLHITYKCIIILKTESESLFSLTTLVHFTFL